MERFLIARKLITGRAQPNDRIVIQYRAQSHTVTLSRTKQLANVFCLGCGPEYPPDMCTIMQERAYMANLASAPLLYMANGF
jgi:hypothetical protein